MTIKSPFLSQFLIAVALTGCGPRDACDDCAAWGDLVDACLEEWVEEYHVEPDCLEGFESEWFNDMGKLDLSDSVNYERYLDSMVGCKSGDDAYDSCKAQQSVSRKVAEAAGNGAARLEVCEEAAGSDVELATAALDCRGYLVALGIAEPE